MILIHALVEVPHTHLAEVSRMVLVEQDPVMMHTTRVSPSSRMLPVFAHTTMAGRDMAPFLAVLFQPGSHGAATVQSVDSSHARKRERAHNAEARHSL